MIKNEILGLKAMKGHMTLSRNTLNPLTKDEIEKIHCCSLDILENTGMKIMDFESLRLLEDSGAEVDYKQEKARFPRELVEDMMKKAPDRFKLAARDPKLDLEVDTENIFFSTANAIDIVDERDSRRITKRDLANYIKIADALENVHFCTGTFVSDAPQMYWDIHQFQVMAENTTKHLRPVIASVKGAEIILKMATAMLGDEDALMKRPILSVGYCSESPLRWGPVALKVFRETAKHNLPVNVESEPLCGGTSPVTLAGAILLANVEVLGGIVLNQLYLEGRPCVYSIGFTHNMDFQGQALAGSPETMLIAAAGAQMAHYYNLPSLSWVGSDSKIADGQAAHEKTLSFLVHVFSGNNLIWGIGSLDHEAAISLEQVVVDNEIISMIQRVSEGIDVTDEKIALDVIKKTGVGGTFLKEGHTVKHYRSEHLKATIDDRRSRFRWEEDGSKNLAERAKELSRTILNEHRPIPLDREVKKKIKEFTKETEG